MQWMHSVIEFNQLTKDMQSLEDSEIVALAKEKIPPMVNKHRCFSKIKRQITKQIKTANSVEDINNALIAIYDFADENRIWLGI